MLLVHVSKSYDLAQVANQELRLVGLVHFVCSNKEVSPKSAYCIYPKVPKYWDT